MSMFDHDSKMYRFPSFHETLTCDQAKTAQESLRDILAKFPSGVAPGSTTSSPPPSSSSSTASSPPPPPSPHPNVAEQKRPSNASDYKWISTCPRSSGSSASSKSSSGSSRNRKTSVSSTGRKSSNSTRSSIASRPSV